LKGPIVSELEQGGAAAEGEKPDEAPETPERKEVEENSTARKLLLAQVLTLLATPLSVAITVYMTDKMKEAKPEIQYVTSSPYYFSPQPSHAERDLIIEDKRLAAPIRDGLMSPPAGQEYPAVCRVWLDDESDWDTGCTSVLRSVAIRHKSMLEGQLENYEAQSTAELKILAPPAKLLTNMNEDVERLS